MLSCPWSLRCAAAARLRSGSTVRMTTPYTGASERSWAGAQTKWSTVQGEAADSLLRHATKRNADHCHTELINSPRSSAMHASICKTTDDQHADDLRDARASCCRGVDARIPVLSVMSQIRAFDAVLSGRVSPRRDGIAGTPAMTHSTAGITVIRAFCRNHRLHEVVASIWLCVDRKIYRSAA